MKKSREFSWDASSYEEKLVILNNRILTYKSVTVAAI